MARLGILIGILLIFVAVGLLLFGIFQTEHPLVSETIESLVCEGAETLAIERQRWALPNGERGENLFFSCELEPGLGRNVTDNASLVLGGLFVIPLMLGILFISLNAIKLQNRQRNRMQTDLSDYLSDFDAEYGDGSFRSVNVHGDTSKLTPEMRDMIENMLGGIIATATGGANADASLSERLRQLDEAYQQNLITKSEYDRVRQAILDSMDD